MHSAYVGGPPARRAILATSREPRCRFRCRFQRRVSAVPDRAATLTASRGGGRSGSRPPRRYPRDLAGGLIMAGRRAILMAVTAVISLAAGLTAVTPAMATTTMATTAVRAAGPHPAAGHWGPVRA